MTDLAVPASAAPTHARRPGRKAALAGALVASGALGVLFGRAHGADPAGLEAPLVLLLRFMALVKAGTVAGLAALVLWRLRRPLGSVTLAAYLAPLTLMASALGLIWYLGLVAPGALAFHVGLIAFLLAAVRDGDVRAALPRRRG